MILDNNSTYSYDNTNQLAGADHSAIGDEGYTYDANGNRTNTGYQTGGNNQLSSDGTYSYTYDNEGNLKTRTEIVTGKVREFTWDYRNRLTGVTDKMGGTVTQQVSYTYDALNQRLAKTVGTQTTRFVYDRGNVYLEFSGTSTTPSTRYLYGPMVDQVLAQESQGQTSWMLTDHLGSVRDLVNNSGAVVNHFTYDSFGQVVSSTGTVDTRYKYTGREYDSETGLYYYRARYFDAGVGRFIGQDPMGFGAGDRNLYRYVRNSSVSVIDPSGLYAVGLSYVPLAGNRFHADIVVSSGELKGQVKAFSAGVGNHNDSEKLILAIYAGITSYDDGIPGTLDFGDIVTDKKGKLVDLDPNLTQKVYQTDDCCDFKDRAEQLKLERRITLEFQKIADKHVKYKLYSMNSNSAAFTVLEKVLGFRPQPMDSSGKPIDAPGWEWDPYTKKKSPQARPFTPQQRGIY